MGGLNQEDSTPSQLGELTLMGVEHEWTRVLVGELQNGALTLAEGDDIRPLIALEVRSGAI